MATGNAPPPSPVLPLAPLEYDVQYINNLVRLLTYYIQQQDNQNQISTGGTGTVTSVGLTLPSIFNVTGSPVTGSGTLAGTLVSEGAHTVFAGPTTGTATPTFRSLVASDLPAVTNLAGGSGGVVPYQSAAGATAFTSTGTAGQVLQSNGTAAPTWVTISSGGGGGLTPVATIAALRSVSKTAIQYAYVEGYYAAGDGGGGNYYYDAADTTSSDNGGSVIVATDGGRWKLSYQGIVSVKQFGAMGNVSISPRPDYTAAFKAAIAFLKSASYRSAFNGGTLYIPQGQYNINDELLIDFTGITIVGDGFNSTYIGQTTANTNIFTFTGSGNSISNINLTYNTGVAVTGGDAISINSDNISVTDVTIDVAYNGIRVYDSVANGDITNIFLKNLRISNIYNSGIFIQGNTTTAGNHNVHDIFIENAIVVGRGGGLGGTAGLLRITEGSNAVLVTNVDVIGGAYSLIINGSSLKPNANYFNNCYFDSSLYGCSIGNATQHQFTNCWFAGGRSGNGYNGLTLSATKGCRFVNSTWFQNGSNGVFVNAGNTFTGFIGCLFAENRAYMPSGGTGDGIVFDVGCQSFQVTDCMATNNVAGLGVQGYGVVISSGCDNFIVTGNNLAGNGTGGIYNAVGTSATKIVANNLT